jgi:D,D-heptose 1,7-bisphosphate phosphatase
VTPLEPIEQAVIALDSDALPGALADVGGQPFLACILRNAARAGVRDLLLLVSGPVSEALADFARQPFGEARCRVLSAPQVLATTDALRHIASALADRFYLLPGDRFFDIDLNVLAPQPPDSLGVLAVRKAGPEEAGRRLNLDEAQTGIVTGFDSASAPTGSALLDSGLCALAREALTVAARANAGADIARTLAAARLLRWVEAEGYAIDLRQPGGVEQARRDLPEALRRPAVFFDRDGVLNHDLGYTHRPEDLRLIDGAAETIRRCNRSGRYVFVVTNQSGVARGLYTVEAVRAFHAAMQRQLRRQGAHIDRLYICPHHPEGSVEAYRQDCDCRKPAPGMLRQALREWPVDVAGSVMIGDRPSDMAAAAACGIKGFQFEGGDLARFCEEHGVI